MVDGLFGKLPAGDLLERCRIYQADFCGLGLGRSKDCTIRECDLSYNGNTGLGMGAVRRLPGRATAPCWPITTGDFIPAGMPAA